MYHTIPFAHAFTKLTWFSIPSGLQHCHEYKNFNTMMSVLSGLSLAAVRRLKRSWEVGQSIDRLSLVHYFPHNMIYAQLV